MTGRDAGGSPGRRRIAALFLVLGAVLLGATVAKDYPREQPVVFRLADTRAVTLTASFTKVGEAQARSGFTLTLPDRRLRDVSHVIHAPNGDYIVTVELRRPRSQNGTDGTDSSEETSVSQRVSLSGSEIVVSVPPRASE
jgi:hypothetical protein